MTTEPSAEEPLVVESMEDVDYLLKRLSELNEIATRENDFYEAMLTRLKKRHHDASTPITDEQKRIREAIATFMQRRRPLIIRRFGKVIVRETGEIKWYIRGPFVETPRNTNAIIDLLLKTRGGKRFVITTHELDRKALPKASPRLLRKLRPLGLSVGKNEYFSIKALGEEESTVVRKRRYPSRRR